MYLRDASKHYDNDSYSGIHPVSEIDTEIIECVRSIANKIGNNEFRRLFRKWKMEPDANVLEELVEFDGEYEVRMSDEPTTDYINIKDLTIKVQMIASVEPFDDYDSKRLKPVYKLIINRDERSKIAFANAEVEFSSAEERGAELTSLCQRLREFTNIRFL